MFGMNLKRISRYWSFWEQLNVRVGPCPNLARYTTRGFYDIVGKHFFVLLGRAVDTTCDLLWRLQAIFLQQLFDHSFGSPLVMREGKSPGG